MKKLKAKEQVKIPQKRSKKGECAMFCRIFVTQNIRAVEPH